MRQQGFERQCSARSKRNKQRCKNFACLDRAVCRMHGGKSRRGLNHPNFRHGRRIKNPPWNNWLLEEPSLVLRIFVFPSKAETALEDANKHILKGGHLDTWLIRPGDISDEAYGKILRRLRREITHCLNELKAASDTAGDETSANADRHDGRA